MLEKLFSSKTRTRLLTLFLTNPEKDFYLRELERQIKITSPSIAKELKNLESLDLLKSKRNAQTKYYQVNALHPLYPELKSMVFKTAAAGDVFREHLGGLGKINAALIYGSFAKGGERPGSDIDFLIIGKPDPDELDKVVKIIGERLAREINYLVFPKKEWDDKVKSKSGLAMDILDKPKIFIIGAENDLR